MFKLLFQSLVAAILAADTGSALSLLHDGQALLLDPLQGPLLHAEALYFAIKKANLEVIKQLLALNVHSDVSFFQFCGQTPLSLAVEQGLKEAIPELVNKTDKNFALEWAVKAHDNKVIDVLMSKCVFKQRFLQYLGIAP